MSKQYNFHYLKKSSNIKFKPKAIQEISLVKHEKLFFTFFQISFCSCFNQP